MTIFDLLLIAIFLVSAATLLAAAIQILTGGFRGGLRTLGRLGFGLILYLGVVCAVSLTAKQQVRALGEQDCRDDWCFAAEKVHYSGQDVTVEFRVWSRALRVTQREYGVHPYLVDQNGREYPVTEQVGRPFDDPIGPGESFLTASRFRVGDGVSGLDLVPRGRSWSPAKFVIADDQSLLHPPTIYRIKPEHEPV